MCEGSVIWPTSAFRTGSTCKNVFLWYLDTERYPIIPCLFVRVFKPTCMVCSHASYIQHFSTSWRAVVDIRGLALPSAAKKSHHQFKLFVNPQGVYADNWAEARSISFQLLVWVIHYSRVFLCSFYTPRLWRVGCNSFDIFCVSVCLCAGFAGLAKPMG